MADAHAELSEAGSTPAIERAKEALTKGMELLAERQKLIKIADRSEFGWGVVVEYTADKLADGSDDEKCLEKAEKAAERKAAKQRTKKRRVEPPARGAGAGRGRPGFGQSVLLMAGRRWGQRPTH